MYPRPSNPDWQSPGRPSTFYRRRSLRPSSYGMTCLALVLHHETDKALLVSDSGDRAKATWIPKSMVSIEPPVGYCFIVASMSQGFAEQKRLAPRFIDPKQFPDSTHEALREATARAARKRNLYRGHHEPNGRHITQRDFC
jgi:hypothetical protein